MSESRPRMAKGYPEGKGRRKIAVSFPQELFLRIEECAQRDKQSFSSVVVDLCDEALKG